MIERQTEKIYVRYLNGPLKSAFDEILDSMEEALPPDCLPSGYRLKSEPHRVRFFQTSLTIWDAEYEGGSPS